MSVITRRVKIRLPNIDSKARYRSMPYQYMSGFSHRGIIIAIITEMMENMKMKHTHPRETIHNDIREYSGFYTEYRDKRKEGKDDYSIQMGHERSRP